MYYILINSFFSNVFLRRFVLTVDPLLLYFALTQISFVLFSLVSLPISTFPMISFFFNHFLLWHFIAIIFYANIFLCFCFYFCLPFKSVSVSNYQYCFLPYFSSLIEILSSSCFSLRLSITWHVFFSDSLFVPLITNFNTIFSYVISIPFCFRQFYSFGRRCCMNRLSCSQCLLFFYIVIQNKFIHYSTFIQYIVFFLFCRNFTINYIQFAFFYLSLLH